MKFYAQDGTQGRQRSPVSITGSVSEDNVKDPKALAKLVRDLQSSVRALQVAQKPDYTEFAVTLAVGKDLSLNHAYGSPVRWYVVDWADSKASATPVALLLRRQQSKCTPDLLYLANGTTVTGVAVIRVEPCQNAITYDV